MQLNAQERRTMIKYKIKNTAYSTNEETGETLVVDDNETVVLHSDNPIEGFNTFWQEAGAKVLNEIKDKPEAYGFNRWTGEKES